MRLELVANVETAADGAEYGADLVTENGQNTNNNNSDKNQDQSVLYQALAFFLSKKASQHDDNSLKR
jgi:hypothetical protein